MRVRITATVTYETNLDPELYRHLDVPPVTNAEILEWEKRNVGTGDTPLIESLRDWGTFHGIRVDQTIEMIG